MYKNTNRSIEAQNEREKRMTELQERYRLEDKKFQLERDMRHERFQLETEAQRMSFQEHLELRRLQFQVKMEKRREDFQKALQLQQIENSREIAQFQSLAMRETQILVARENAQNMLQSQMIQDALKTFPLNISPLVLLSNRPNTLSSLLRFTITSTTELNGKNRKKGDLVEVQPQDVLEDVMKYRKHPEALNIFIAPIFVDSKLSFQKSLSSLIWDATYQKVERLFTKNYSRASDSPVVFYPTAWNDRLNSGVHASETLHFFLKDLPCVVLEPKFDGHTFSMAISTWGLGYCSTEHYRIESSFDVNIDIEIANAVYERSRKSLDALDIISRVDKVTNKSKDRNNSMEALYVQNIELYKAFRIGEYDSLMVEEKEDLLNKIDALGISNIFAVDNQKDFEPLANYFAKRIGLTLAMLADIHHMISTSALPKLPKLMQTEPDFVDLYSDSLICTELYKSYKSILRQIRDEECSMADDEEALRIYDQRNLDLEAIQKNLKVIDDSSEISWEERIRMWVKRHLKYEHNSFDRVWSKFVEEADISYQRSMLPLIKDKSKRKQLDSHIEDNTQR